MAGATEDAEKGGMFCTGSGRSVGVSDMAIRRARALVGEEAEEKISIHRKQPFADGADLDGLIQTDNLFKAGLHKDGTTPMFQTGSGKAVTLSKDSIQKARTVLEGNIGNASGAMQPMFHTGIGRPVSTSRGNIDKARVVLEGQKIAKQVLINEKTMERSRSVVKNDAESSALGRPVALAPTQTSIQKASASLAKENIKISGDNTRMVFSFV